MKIYNNFCSYLFFALLVFNALALLSSEFSHTFSQVFMLLSHDGRIFNLFSLIFVFVCVCFVCYSLITFYKTINRSVVDSISFITTLCFIVLMILVFLFFYLWNDFFHPDLSQDSIKNYTFLEYLRTTNFLLTLGCGVFLCICPLSYYILSLSLSVQNPYARVFLILKPDINTAIFYPSGTLLPSIFF